MCRVRVQALHLPAPTQPAQAPVGIHASHPRLPVLRAGLPLYLPPEGNEVKHNRARLLRWTSARTPWVRAVRAWRNLLPDWIPSLDELVALESMPHEHRAVVRVISDGWEPNDPRWDCLMALLEWERRMAVESARTAEAFQDFKDEWDHGWDPEQIVLPDNVVSMDEEYERLRADSETTVETELPKVGCSCGSCQDIGCDVCPCHQNKKLVLVPTEPSINVATGRTLKAFTVRTLRSIREEQLREED